MGAKTIACAILVGYELFACIGCTHAQLRRSSLRQNTTLSDIQCQQVLDNIARFTENPRTMPYFAYAGTGSTQVSDTGTLGPLSFSWIVPSQGVDIQSARQLTETWNLTAVNNPDKLYAMRCAYQILVGASYDECDGCIAKLAPFLGTAEEKGKTPSHDCVPSDLKDANDRVLAKLHCYLPTGWYNAGKRCDVPKNACYVSRCADSYVWVMPSGMDGLTKFTLTILDIATFSTSGPSGSWPEGAMPSGGAPLKPREPSFQWGGPTYVPR